MARIAIVGGHGKVARLLTPLLVARHDEVISLVRLRAQADAVAALGARPRHLDIERDDVDAFVAAFAEADAVVFAAGAGPDGRADRKETVDLGGSLRSVEAATRAGVWRFVQVSAIGVDEPPDLGAGPVWSAYVRAKRDADAALRASDLAWTIVRPGRLTDAPGTGRVHLAPTTPHGEVPRADVAAVLAAVLAEPRSAWCQWDLVTGPDPVADAVARALPD